MKTALEKIARIREHKTYDSLDVTPQGSPGGFLHQDKEFLLKAFDVMREIATHIDKMNCEAEGYDWPENAFSIDEEFEKRMNNAKS